MFASLALEPQLELLESRFADRFTGRRLDKETGLSYYRARYYCDRIGVRVEF